MSTTHTELQRGTKRIAITEGYGRKSKRVKPNDDASTSITPSCSGSMPSSTNGPDQTTICQPCRKWGVFEAFLDVIEHREKSRRIPSRRNQPLHKSCPSCSILLRAEQCDQKTKAVYFYHFNESGSGSTPTEVCEGFRLVNSSRTFSIRKPRKDHTPEVTKFKQTMQDSVTFNCSTFQNQLRICQEKHRNCRLRDGQVVRGLKVIDCQTRQIIQAQPDCAYVALSYVWGSGNSGDLQNLPRTIADALSVTLSLGFRYLWVDRYCIDQQNNQEKHSQIQQMGLIYGQAQLTIVAAAGRDPTHGLPGVSFNRPSKVDRSKILLNQHTLYPMHQTSEALLSASVWMSRAWTYQEFVLSKRRLIFTDQHAFLECQETMVEEWPASVWRNTFAPEKTEGMGCHLRDTLSFREDMSALEQFSETLRRYSKRSLTYASDTLNGILGVLSTFEQMSTPIYHLHGLPYTFDGRKARLQLAWICSAAGTHSSPDPLLARRKLDTPVSTKNQLEDFPSWSWTAWAGLPMFYKDLTHSIFPQVFVKLMKSSEVVQLEEYTRRRLSGEDIVASPSIWVTGWILPVKPFRGNGHFCITLGESERFATECDNLALSRAEVFDTKELLGELIAFFVGYHIYGFQFLLLEYNTDGYRRIGVFTTKLGTFASLFSFESALLKLRERLPHATRRIIRLS